MIQTWRESIKAYAAPHWKQGLLEDGVLVIGTHPAEKNDIPIIISEHPIEQLPSTLEPSETSALCCPSCGRDTTGDLGSINSLLCKDCYSNFIRGLFVGRKETLDLLLSEAEKEAVRPDPKSETQFKAFIDIDDLKAIMERLKV